MNQKRILIVDDDTIILRLLKTNVQKNYPHYDVSIATDGRLALDYLRQHHPIKAFDIIITDYEMPFMDGADFARAVRSTWPTIPIVLMSAINLDHLQKQIKTVSFDDYLQKPFDVKTFNQLICTHTGCTNESSQVV